MSYTRPHHKKSIPDIDVPFNGYSNVYTWELANVISNDERLYNKCKEHYANGYITWGSMGCKLREDGPYWVYGKTKVDLRTHAIRAAEITRLLKDLFHPKTK